MLTKQKNARNEFLVVKDIYLII